MYAMTEVVCEILEDKPRYLMGVGTPINILENIAQGYHRLRWFRLWVHESLLVFVASAFLLINSLP
jgi:hypothetical protein